MFTRKRRLREEARMTERALQQPRPTPMFHSRDGVYFGRRSEDRAGAVTIAYPGGLTTVDADTWASIVASVSSRGENAETFGEARRFHG